MEAEVTSAKKAAVLCTVERLLEGRWGLGFVMSVQGWIA